ncbi:MAG TPA: tetratricopeptide repeat protein [bacterium]
MNTKDRFYALGTRYAEQGKIKNLENLLEKLKRRKPTAEYFYLSARLWYLKGGLAEALSSCDRSYSLATRTGRTSLRCQILIMKSAILRRQGEYLSSNRVLLECLGIAKGKDPALCGDIYNTMGVNYWMMAEFEQAKKYYRKAHRISKNINENILFLKSSINLGIVPLHQGNFFEAEVYLRNAIELCEKEKQERLKIYAMLNLGELFGFSGKWELGKKVLDQCRRSGSKLGLVYEQGASMWLLGNIFRDDQDFMKARQLYTAALKLLERSSSYSECLYVYFNLGVLERLCKDYPKALVYMNEAEKIINQTKERLVQGLFHLEKGYLLWLIGEHDAAFLYLEKGLEETGGRQYDHMVGLLYSYIMRKVDGGKHPREFERLLKLCAKRGYYTIFIREQETLLGLLSDSMARSRKAVLPRVILLDLATRDKRIVDVLLRQESRACREAAFYVIERLQLLTYIPVVKELVWDLNSPATQKAVEMLERMDTGARVPHLKIDLMGRFKITRGGDVNVPINREKARNLLKILILHNKRALVKDQLMEMLWPGDPPRKSFNSLRQTVFLLRRDLQHYGLDADELVHRDHGMYEFRHPDQKLEVDYFQFISLAKKGDLLMDKGDTKQALVTYEQALEKYRGPLLPENIYDAWIEPIRRHIRSVFAQVARIVHKNLEITDAQRAGRFWRDVVERDHDAFNLT